MDAFRISNIATGRRQAEHRWAQQFEFPPGREHQSQAVQDAEIGRGDLQKLMLVLTGQKWLKPGTGGEQEQSCRKLGISIHADRRKAEEKNYALPAYKRIPEHAGKQEQRRY